MQRQENNAFTLIEMLTVMVIVALILTISIPAITNLMKSGGVNAAGREVSNTLSLARQLAITQRIYARVVFPYTGTLTHLEMRYHTYAVMTNRVNNVAANWRYASKWEYLPTGATFLEPPMLAAGNGALDDSLNSEAGLPFPDVSPGNIGQLRYIEFGPTGAAKSFGAADSVLAITEGFVNNSGTPTATASTTSANQLANLTTITVNSLVGRVQVARP